MRIVIVGAGQVGYHLAERLSEEGQDVVMIETNPERAAFVGDRLDVLSVVGNGASLQVLEEAGTKDAGLFLAVTDRDEVNILSCLSAAAVGVSTKVARVSNPELYIQQGVLSRERLGIDLMINPERECAWETFQLLGSEAATELVRFAEGKVQLIGLRVKEGAPVAGKTLAELDRELQGRRYVTVAISRDGETEVPTGSSRIEAGDLLFVLSPAAEMRAIPPLAGYAPHELRRVMIAGGSQEAMYLAQHLAEHDVSCTILEMDRSRCVQLSEALPDALVLHGDATDMELLEMEGVAGVDGFVAYTDHDETNMLSSLLAKASGARKVISLLHRLQYIPLVSRVGIDAAVSPRMSAVNTILRYVRGGNVARVATMKGIDAEAIEVTISSGARALGRPFHEVDFPEGGLVGAIIRDGHVITPRGGDSVQVGDRVILFSVPEAVAKLERLFA